MPRVEMLGLPPLKPGEALTLLPEWKPVLLPAEHGLARLRAAGEAEWRTFCSGRPTSGRRSASDITSIGPTGC
jgi:hypothetical protein